MAQSKARKEKQMPQLAHLHGPNSSGISKKLAKQSRFLFSIAASAIFMISAVSAFARPQSSGAPAMGIQPDAAHPVLAIGAAAPDFALPGVASGIG